jgi:hypothetical protein
VLVGFLFFVLVGFLYFVCPSEPSGFFLTSTSQELFSTSVVNLIFG